MTKAYIEGFRKTAEAYGIEPQELLKAAAAFTGAKVPTHPATRELIDGLPGYVYSEYNKGTLGNHLNRMISEHRLRFGLRPTNPWFKKMLEDIDNNEAAKLSGGLIDPKFHGAFTNALDKTLAPMTNESVRAGLKTLTPKARNEIALNKWNEFVRNFHSATGFPTRVSSQK